MEKSLFFYGTMNSGKTAQLLMNRYNYMNNGTDVIVVKPEIDTRTNNKIYSRIGLSTQANVIFTSLDNNKKINNSLMEIVSNFGKTNNHIHVIMFDEAQFFSSKAIKSIFTFFREEPVLIMAYGLLKDFKGQLFNGAQAWIEQCDCIREIKSQCSFCNRKAIYDVRFIKNKPTFNGNVVEIGDSEYKSVCREHYYQCMHEYMEDKHCNNA